MSRALLLLAVLVGAAVGQESSSKGDALRARLKEAVDRSLARFVRDLRTELHRAVDTAVDKGDPGAIAELLEDLRSGGRRAAPKPKVVIEPDQLITVDRVLRRLDRLRDLAGPDHLRFKQVESSVRQLLGPAIDVERAPWHRLGLSVAPVSGAFRAKHDLPSGSGLTIVAVDAGSVGAAIQMKEGEVIIDCDGKPVGLGQAGSAALARSLAVSDGRLMHLGVVGKDGQRARRALPLPGGLGLSEDDPKALLEEMMRKALKEIIPDGPVVVPPVQRGSGKKLL